jgi:hypothetical protein
MSSVHEGGILLPTSSRAGALSRRLIYSVLLFFTAAASFNGFYTKVKLRDGIKFNGFESIIEGTANRPYIARQLIPTVANWADRVAPESLKSKLQNVAGDTVTGIYASLFPSSPVAQNPTYQFRYLVFYLEVFVFAELAVFLLYFVCRAYGYAPHVSLTASCLLVLLIPYIEVHGGGFYTDFSELAFLALGVLVAHRFHWLWLLPVAFLATFNKETYLLILVMLWPILSERYGKIRAAVQVALTLALAVPLDLLVRYHFRNNPGGTVEIHVSDQLAFLVHPGKWLLKFGNAYGVFVPEMLTVIPMVLLALLVRYGWKRMPPSIRQHGIVGLCMNVPLYLAFSNPGEMRDFSILFVVLLILFAANLAEAETAVAAA